MIARARAWLPSIALLAFCLGFWAALFYIAPLIVGVTLAALLVIGLAYDLVRWCRHDRDDCGYATTPFGLEAAPPVTTETIHTSPAAFTVIEGGKRAVWPHEAGAPE